MGQSDFFSLPGFSHLPSGLYPSYLHLNHLEPPNSGSPLLSQLGQPSIFDTQKGTRGRRVGRQVGGYLLRGFSVVPTTTQYSRQHPPLLSKTPAPEGSQGALSLFPMAFWGLPVVLCSPDHLSIGSKNNPGLCPFHR